MSTLIVLLPSGDSLVQQGGDSMPLMFALLDRGGTPTQTGCSPLAALPKAATTVLVVSARDTLLLNVPLPPLTGSKLRRALPNIIEEHLIQDAQRCHIAVDPVEYDSDEHCVAVVDREWFAALLGRFAQAGHRKIRAVPLVHCLPRAQADAQVLADEASDAAASVLIVGRGGVPAATPEHADADVAGCFELAVAQRTLGFGMTVNAAQLDATIGELAQRHSLSLHALETDSAEWLFKLPAHRVDPLPLAAIAARALACRFDLCQFEFASFGRTAAGGGGLRPWRIALGFVAASLAVSIAAANAQWWQAARRQDGLVDRMTQIVKTAFPDTPMILAPHDQMEVNMKRLRAAAGELHSDDFLALSAAFARALRPIPSTSIAELNYSSDALDVTFKPGAHIDEDGLKRRLAANDLSAQEDNGKWSIRSTQSKPR